MVTEPAPTAEAVASLLALSDERDRYERRILAAWRDGYRAGYDQAVADEAIEWEVTRGILKAAVHPVLDPEGDVRERVRAAEAAERRDAAERERAFAERARNTPPHQRTYVQDAVVLAFRPRRPA
jgi:hypothetical protein